MTIFYGGWEIKFATANEEVPVAFSAAGAATKPSQCLPQRRKGAKLWNRKNRLRELSVFARETLFSVLLQDEKFAQEAQTLRHRSISYLNGSRPRRAAQLDEREGRSMLRPAYV
jgi:hypothetical protein